MHEKNWHEKRYNYLKAGQGGEGHLKDQVAMRTRELALRKQLSQQGRGFHKLLGVGNVDADLG